ncbi:MAG TPA: histidine kinase dimerization/phospho-acceptor domain-containing protein [Gemmatimonadales bacterium]|nr:histidine kinase dimerization/phospho-acceptor domain-containing protein [Gemmatimonadales bacterium]
MSDSLYSRIKHDLANPLSAILAETQLLLMRAEEIPPDMLESLRAIESGAMRMREMLRALKAE